MMCRACQETDPAGGAGEERRVERRRDPHPINLDRKLDRIPDQLCSRCGKLVGPEDTVKKVRDKHSQLERFGLAGKRKPLLEPKRRRKDP
jgi:hypothetical protein